MSKYHRPDAQTIQSLKDIANKLRIHSIEATNASNSGHPSSCCSAAEVMSVLFFNTMRYTIKEPRHPNNDRFVLSKGHAAPILYAAWAETGLFPTSELLELRKLTSDLEGHPTPRLNFVDVATGSLGQGLSCAAGMAYTGKYFDKSDYRVYCLIGDGESAEGSIWEALAFSSRYQLDNLVAIFDINRLGQSEATSLGHDVDIYKARVEAFGWNTYVVDGHDVEELCKVFWEARQVTGRPTCILAKTFKGQGIPGVADAENWHGKPLGDKAKEAIAAIRENIANSGPHNLIAQQPTLDLSPVNTHVELSAAPSYKLGESVATRLAYGTALVKLGKANNRVVAMDGDTKNSTFAQKFKDAFPDRFIECYIAEQNLVGVGIGCATRDRTIPFISTFAAFFTRAFDQIRMGAISQTNANFVGSHAGVSIGEDGPSQMALEDLAMFRTIPGSTVFYPTDAVSTERAVELAANTKGVCFIRTSRPNVPVIYKNDEPFAVGKAKVVRSSPSDQVTVIGSCVTLYEAIKAADTLAESGINIRIIDPFTIKPIDAETIIANAQETNGKIITVEDHYAEGGIGEAVAGAVSGQSGIIVKRLYVPEVPRSGKCEELMEKYGISASCIVKAVNSILSI
ncbi:transketolase [Biomphalaria glabrata]|uniref:Transketolase n=1 Tax=Biomphalaria glabrata TaxID=6526 RepID=A0A9U8DW49_BIOGL|nr:transketolase-like [Biomphalaria glabrata]KAI8739758.1 transketolase-like [Biomphalaria glabrata]KAI8772034.1 transketolase [Biomphalaria glabrata]